MSELKRTQLYDVHVAAGATMVDFGGWEMPIKYPTDIVAEHLYTRSFCSLFDVSHMGRILVDGPQAVPTFPSRGRRMRKPLTRPAPPSTSLPATGILIPSARRCGIRSATASAMGRSNSEASRQGSTAAT